MLVAIGNCIRVRYIRRFWLKDSAGRVDVRLLDRMMAVSTAAVVGRVDEDNVSAAEEVKLTWFGDTTDAGSDQARDDCCV